MDTPLRQKEDAERGKKRAKRYTRELEQRAARMAIQSDKPLTEVAQELGVTHGALYEWVRQAEGQARPLHGAPLVEKPDEQRSSSR